MEQNVHNRALDQNNFTGGKHEMKTHRYCKGCKRMINIRA